MTLTLLVLLLGCETGPSPAEQAVMPLCQWGQLEHLQLRMLPEDTPLKEHVRDADRRWLEDDLARQQAQNDSQNPLKALAAGLVESIAAMGKAVTEASAEHADCSVETLSQSDTEAKLKVRREVPDITPKDPGERSAAMAKLKTHEERVKALSRMLAEADASKVETVEVHLIREGERWVIDYGLPEAAVAALEAEAVAAQAQLDGMPAQQALLDKLKVTEAAVVEQRDGMLRQSALRLGLENGLDQTVVAGTFVGTVRDGAQELGSREFDMQLPEALAPGQAGTWVLSGNAFRAIGQLAKQAEGSAVQVTPLELRGGDEAEIASVRQRVNLEGDLAKARGEAAAIREKYLR